VGGGGQGAQTSDLAEDLQMAKLEYKTSLEQIL
jgi:hypothetical protein